jgi:hypothetical protein
MSLGIATNNLLPKSVRRFLVVIVDINKTESIW